jgi:hypothetical protein
MASMKVKNIILMRAMKRLQAVSLLTLTKTALTIKFQPVPKLMLQVNLLMLLNSEVILQMLPLTVNFHLQANSKKYHKNLKNLSSSRYSRTSQLTLTLTKKVMDQKLYTTMVKMMKVPILLRLDTTMVCMEVGVEFLHSRNVMYALQNLST